MSDREMILPKKEGKQEQETQEVKVQQEEKKETLTPEEAEYIEKVFFEEDEKVKLRDGMTYTIPPLGLKDAKELMKKLNSIDTAIIIANLIEDEEGNSNYNELLEVLLMGFKPYYKDMTVEYLEEYVDIVTAKQIIDILIGLNGLKKSL